VFDELLKFIIKTTAMPPSLFANAGFGSLSLKDLLQAREAYHVHLMRRAM
jgi:hypothetical protein